MSRFSNPREWVDHQRIEIVIQALLAIGLLVIGLYIAGPWYVGGPTTSVGVAIEYAVSRGITGAFYVICGAISLWGVAKNSPELRHRGSLLLFLGYTFLTLLRLITFGLTPLHWLFTLLLALIAGIVRITEFRKRENGSG